MLLTRLQLALVGGLAALLLVAAVVQTVRLNGFLWLDGALDKLAKVERSLNEARAALDDAHAKTRKAQEETARLIQQAGERNKSADDKASRIERVVLPGSCKTPREIMELDI